VQTSKEGGCQVWVFSGQLTVELRLEVQRYYQTKLGSDVGALSGMQFARLPGGTNYKRDGQWVNVLRWPRGQRFALPESLRNSNEATSNIKIVAAPEKAVKQQLQPVLTSTDTIAQLKQEIALCARFTTDTSVAEFRACSALLKNKIAQDEIIVALTAIATRKKKYAKQYATRTVNKVASWMH
jgi:outer membrane receptor for Fe3+-dicitrate